MLGEDGWSLSPGGRKGDRHLPWAGTIKRAVTWAATALPCCCYQIVTDSNGEEIATQSSPPPCSPLTRQGGISPCSPAIPSPSTPSEDNI